MVFGKAGPAPLVDLAARAPTASDRRRPRRRPPRLVARRRRRRQRRRKDDLLIGAPWADPGTPPRSPRAARGGVRPRGNDRDRPPHRHAGLPHRRRRRRRPRGLLRGHGRRQRRRPARLHPRRDRHRLPQRQPAADLPRRRRRGFRRVRPGHQGTVDLANLGDDGFRINGDSGDSRPAGRSPRATRPATARTTSPSPPSWAARKTRARRLWSRARRQGGRRARRARRRRLRLDGEAEDQSGCRWPPATSTATASPSSSSACRSTARTARSCRAPRTSSRAARSRRHDAREPACGRLPHRRRQDPGRPRRSVATSPDLNADGIGDVLPAPRVGIARPGRPSRAPPARRSRSAPLTSSTAPRPPRTSRRHDHRQGPLLRAAAACAGATRRAGASPASATSAASTSSPSASPARTQPADARRHRPRPRPGLLLNGVTDPLVPTISITSPTDGPNIPQGTPVALAFSCDDDQIVVSCTATDRGVAIANGAALPTSPDQVGPHTVIVTAKDAAGNATIKSVTYNVVASATTTPGGTVPATLSLSLPATASLGSLIPGIAGSTTRRSRRT